VDDRYWSSLSSSERSQFNDKLDDLASDFDTSLYPRSHELYGEEPIPGVDGDPRVTILLEELAARSGGYYETRHYYASSVLPESNEREMVFVSAESVLEDRADAFVTHELQHLISFNQKEVLQRINEDTWLNEARSEYVVSAVGLNAPFPGSTLQSRASSFIRAGTDSLVEWPNTTTDYGIASLFVHYLAEQFGSDAVSRTLSVPHAGTAAVNASLATESSPRRFSQVFNDWMVAVSVNERSAGDRFGYRADGLDTIHIIPAGSERLNAGDSFSATETLEEWEPLWYELSVPSEPNEPGSVSVEVDGGDGTIWAASITARYADGSFVVYQPSFGSGSASVAVPRSNPTPLVRVYLAVAQGSEASLGDRAPLRERVTVSAVLGDEAGTKPETVVVSSGGLVNGDLMSYPGAPGDTYVVWDGYRRYLPAGVLALYGFEDRPVHVVSQGSFFDYAVSNYIRTDADDRVFAVRPEGTKHWLNMTEAQFLGSGRDPGAIFTVNEAESAFYQTGEDVTR
jgi:hypothetical protein